MPFNERKKEAQTLEFYFDRYSSGSNYNDNASLQLLPQLQMRRKGKALCQTHIIDRSVLNKEFDIDQSKIPIHLNNNIEDILNKRRDNIKGILTHYIKINEIRKIDINNIDNDYSEIIFNFDDKTILHKLNEDDNDKYDKKFSNSMSQLSKTPKLLSNPKLNEIAFNSILANHHTSSLFRIREPIKMSTPIASSDRKDQAINNETIPNSVTKLVSSNVINNKSQIINRTNTKNQSKNETLLPLKDFDYSADSKINPKLFKKPSSLSKKDNGKENEYRQLRIEYAKIYDSLSDNEEEDGEIESIFHPESLLMFFWDIWISVIMIYNTTYIPFSIAFFESNIIYAVVFDYLVNITMIADLILYFFLPYPKDNNDHYQFDKTEIVTHYLLGWFIIDFISAIPFSSFFHFQKRKEKLAFAKKIVIQSNKPEMIFKLFPLLKLLKLIYYNKQKKRKNNANHSLLFFWIPTHIRRICSFFFYFVMITHVLGCIWCFVGSFDYYNWIVKNRLQDESNVNIYFASLYFVLASVFTVGYGDIVSVSYYERGYNIFLMIIGLFLNTYIISSIIILFRKSHKEERLEKYINVLDNIKIQYKVDMNLYWKIRKWLTYENEANRDEQMNFISEFSYSVQNTLFTEMHTDILNYKFFNNTNIKFKIKVIRNLKPLFAERGTLLVKANDIIDELIFVKRGRIELEYYYGQQIIKISKIFRGEHFGEINMIMNKRSNFDIVVKSKAAELLLLNKQILIEICNEFPHFFHHIKQISLFNYNLFAAKLNRKIDQIKNRYLLNKTNNNKGDNNINVFIDDYNINNNDNDHDSVSCKGNSLSLSKGNQNQVIETIREEEEENNNALSGSSRGNNDNKIIQSSITKLNPAEPNKETNHFLFNPLLKKKHNQLSPVSNSKRNANMNKEQKSDKSFNIIPQKNANLDLNSNDRHTSLELQLNSTNTLVKVNTPILPLNKKLLHKRTESFKRFDYSNQTPSHNRKNSNKTFNDKLLHPKPMDIKQFRSCK